MREIVIFAGLLVGGGVMAARIADRAVHTTEPPPAVAAVASVPPVAAARQDSDGSSVVVPADARGPLRGRRQGRRASHGVHARYRRHRRGAARARCRAASASIPRARDFTVEVETANGVDPGGAGATRHGGGRRPHACAMWRRCVSPDEASRARTCSARRSCRGCGASNSATAGWCSSSSRAFPRSASTASRYVPAAWAKVANAIERHDVPQAEARARSQHLCV